MFCMAFTFAQTNHSLDSITFHLKHPLLEIKSDKIITTNVQDEKFIFHKNNFLSAKNNHYNLLLNKQENIFDKSKIFNPNNAHNIVSALVLGMLNYGTTSFD